MNRRHLLLHPQSTIRVLTMGAVFSLICVTTAPRAWAQGLVFAPSTFIEPSIGASGMGRAGVSVFWGDHPDGWANPALLGFHSGIRFVHGRTELVPDLSDQVVFTTNELLIGGGGLGIRMSGKPIKALGSLRLDYGPSQATDVDGNVIGVFDAYEEIHDLAIGINLLEAVETMRRIRGHEGTRLSRRLDLSVGHSWKSVTVDFAPAQYLGSESGNARERDRGALLRVTPLDQLPREGGEGGEGRGLRGKIDAAFGVSQRNYRTGVGGATGSQTIIEERLLGGSALVTLRLPGAAAGGVWDFLEPTIAFGATMESVKYYNDEDQSGAYPATRSGQELTLFDAISFRHGHVNDDAGIIIGDTFGVGARLRYKKMIGVAYNYASVPQWQFLEDLTRHAISAFVDPLLLWKALR